MTEADIPAALGGACRSGTWHRCRCPVHQSSGPTLALCDGPRRLIAHCHVGCSRDDVHAELRRLGLLDGAGSAVLPEPNDIGNTGGDISFCAAHRAALTRWEHIHAEGGCA